ncbi:Ig-like domain-containing protein [Stigmatella aurantiaca]|uniref:chitinase n=1 Tax=Stigmatella aurantiaca (strain DW4/3-1) TaxID=378806 RepID=E3FMX2_STIAD|nr:Ig-like domain-containing protein [Stigmatella aurantiaca]ADO73087.1 Chitinase-like protein [Stigmatella aurantiaca DW4/3-1]
MRQPRKLIVTALVGALAACGEEPREPVQLQSLQLAASAAGLKATFATSSSWQGGFNGVFTIQNTTSSAITDWSLKVKFNGSVTVRGSPWGAGGSVSQGTDGSWTFLPNSWGGNVVPAQGSVTVTFEGAGTYGGLSSCSINGYSCDGTPPTDPDDKTPPTVSLSASPTRLTSVGSVTLSAPASDNVGVTRVEFYKNGVLLSTDTSSPYSASDSFSSHTQNGTYSYTAKAFDAGGNSATSSAASVTVVLPVVDPPPPGGRMYIGYASSWNTSIVDLTTANIPSYYTHLNLSFVRPNTAYQKGSFAFDQEVAGLEFFEGATTNTGQKKFTPAQAQTLISNIQSLRARGTQVWLSVGGWSYSQGSQWASFSAPRVVDLAQDLGADGIDIDWESSGSSCNKLGPDQFSCSKDGEIANIITSLDSTIRSRGLKMGISIAGWSTGAYYVKGTPFEEGKVQWGSPFGGTMYSVVKNHGNKLHHINLMSYDGGEYYDPREGYESYRAIYSGPIAMGLEIAPEGAGGATLRLNADPGTVYDAEMLTGQNNMATKYYNVETLATYMKNKGKATDGMMVWQIWKERVHMAPPAGAATVNSAGQRVCQILGITSNCNQSIPNLPKY